MVLLKMIADFIRGLWTNHSTAIVAATTAVAVGTTFVVIEGYEGSRESELKIGITLHSQGDILAEDEDGIFQHKREIGGELYGPKFDIINNPSRWGRFLGQVGVDRFGLAYGCSYTVIVTPDSSLWMKRVGGIGAHASGYNSPLVGVMMTRTDNDSLNKLTLWQTRLVISALKDSLDVLFDQDIDLIVFHSDIATNGKQDPQEFRPMIDKLGLRWDNRNREGRIRGVPTLSKAMRKWDRTTKKLMDD